jgi:hypothetical protein
MMRARLSVSLHHADLAWLVMVTGIVAYEVLAKDGELLSHGTERYLERHPWLTRFVIAATAAHLAKLIPQQVDVYHRDTWKAVAALIRSRHPKAAPDEVPAVVPLRARLPLADCALGARRSRRRHARPRIV